MLGQRHFLGLSVRRGLRHEELAGRHVEDDGQRHQVVDVHSTLPEFQLRELPELDGLALLRKTVGQAPQVESSCVAVPPDRAADATPDRALGWMLRDVVS